MSRVGVCASVSVRVCVKDVEGVLWRMRVGEVDLAPIFCVYSGRVSYMKKNCIPLRQLLQLAIFCLYFIAQELQFCIRGATFLARMTEF